MTAGTSGRRSRVSVPVQAATASSSARGPVRLARQRRPGWIAAGVALLALGVLANVYLFQAASDRTSVVRVARDVPVGQPLTRADLDTTVVALGPEVRAIPGRQLGEVVGRRAAVGLRAGTLLTASQVTAQLTPGPGQALVAVPLKPSQLPPRGLEPGSQIRVVATSGSQDESTPQAGQASGKDVAAVVDAVGAPDADGAVTVSLLVADGDASAVARLAAAGRVALVVTSRVGS
jgi:hypothetical protein